MKRYLVCITFALLAAFNAFGQFGTSKLTNKSGGTLSQYAVVVVDTANNSAFTTTTSERAYGVVGVCAEDIENDSTGRIAMFGIYDVTCAGAVTRGDYLITSTTAGSAASGSTNPAGAFGIALEAGTDTEITAVLIAPCLVSDISGVNIENFATSGAAGTAPVSDGSNGLTMTDILTEAELDSIAELEAQVGSINIIVSTEIDTLPELETLMSGINILASTEIDSEAKLEALVGIDFLKSGDGNFVPSSGASTQMLQYSSAGAAKWVTFSGMATIADGGAITLQGSPTFTAITVPTLNTASGSMTLTPTDNLYVGASARAAATIAGVQAAAGQARSFAYYSGTALRWAMQADNTAESGSNAGSAFKLIAYDDAGSQIDVPVTIVRASDGAMTILRPAWFGGNVSLSNAASTLRLKESSGDTYYANIDAGDLDADRTYTLSANEDGTIVTATATGNAGYILQEDGDGTFSFVADGMGVDGTADNDVLLWDETVDNQWEPTSLATFAGLLALDEDDVTDDNVETMATAGGAGTVPMSDGAAGLAMTDVLVPSELDSESELETLLVDVTDVYTDNDGSLDDDDITDDVIGDLSDVDTTGAVLGSILKYDGSDWVIGIDATGSGTVPDGNADNDVLLWDETTTQTWLATSAANFKAALDLEVGTDLQAYNAELAGIASATLSSAGTLYTDGSQGYSLKVIGTDIQAYDAALAGVAGASGAGLYYTDGSDNISLKAIGTDIQAQDADLEGISDATLTTAGLLYTDGSQTYSTKATRSKAILLTAAGGTPATKGGCADAALSANDIYTLDFDASADENAVWMLPLPADYASGDFAVTFYYSVASDWADSADKVNWAIKGVSLANSDALNGAYGTAVEANDVWDTGETVNEMLTVAASSDLSITGVAAGEFVKICVYRDADDATNDTCTADGRLIAVKLEYTASIY